MISLLAVVPHEGSTGLLARVAQPRSASHRQATLHNSRFSHHSIDARLAAFQMGDEQNLVARWLRPIGVLRPVVCAFHDDVEHGVFDLVIGVLISGEASGEALLYLRVCASSYWGQLRGQFTRCCRAAVGVSFRTNNCTYLGQRNREITGSRRPRLRRRCRAMRGAAIPV